jgi:hypothetical protein
MVRRVAPPVLVLLGPVACIPWSWVPLLVSLPWIAAVLCLTVDGGVDDGDPPSMAETVRRRLSTL